ncbi:MAG: hypothetical protein JST93_14480 [Acidobacteria bacterium]|nr:hypothetical protein [Acidobacteriota bacterium]
MGDNASTPQEGITAKPGTFEHEFQVAQANSEPKGESTDAPDADDSAEGQGQADELEQDDQDATDITDDDEDDSIPELRIDDPEAKKVWEQQWKGIQKVKERLKEGEADLQRYRDNKDRFEALNDLANGIADKATYRETFQKLAEAVAQQHGVKPEALFGHQADEQEQDDFDFEDDRKVYQRAKADALAEIRKELSGQFADLDAMRQDFNKRKAQNEFETRLSQEFPKLQRKLEAETGIKFTKAQIADGIRNNPDIKDLVKAVKVEHLELIQREQSKRVFKTAGKGPEIVPEADRSGKPDSRKTNRKYGFEDALRDMGVRIE